MSQPHEPAITVAALYCFTRFNDPPALRGPLLALCAAQGLCGTLLLAGEGINGTIAGRHDGVMTVIDHIRALPGCGNLEVKYSHALSPPFQRLKVRIKREIVTMGVPDIDPIHGQGAYVSPYDWNRLIADPDTVVIDTRNGFEIEHGSFAGAIDPGTTSFREFPQWFDDQAEQWRRAGTKIAMFCTGGIRCEKATAYARAQGFDAVYHLKGGILKYLEEVPPDQSQFQGSCFVFDERVALEHGLAIAGDSADDERN
ncbi:rhodanese-related sulfurtransferase [Blastomonas sp.]|uniref:oxygen-dependent tRNA uridine(34) hydroxylase TrhO n=1 Tax=Blastomonas sp. TaxID=1909299 RepID=UPI003593A7F0